MLQIRPVSDLRNKFSEIENIVVAGKKPVFLTKNGYGSMVVMSLEMYESLYDNTESSLDEADFEAKTTDVRLTHDEVFAAARARIKG